MRVVLLLPGMMTMLLVGSFGLANGQSSSSCSPRIVTTNPPEAARSYSGVHSNHLIGTGQARSMLDSAESWV
eukprot:COSAG01_NODE_4176_length_5267_cov_34.739164_10_plen_71_part_01